MLAEVPVHNLEAGGKQLLESSENKSGLSASSSSHLGKVLRLREGGRHLVLGKNGCGKSTLLRAVASGELPGWPKNLSTYLVDQELSMDPSLTPLEVVLRADAGADALRREAAELEATCAEADETPAQKASARLCEIYAELDLLGAEPEEVRERRAAEILQGLGFGEARRTAPIGSLSGGWKMRAAIAAALFVKPRLLMLDEPTNHLDLGAIDWLQNHLINEYKGTLLCVSHDRSFINNLMTEIIIFADYSLTYFAGTLEEFESAAEQMAKNLERQQAALDKKRDHMEKSIQNLEKSVARQDKNKARNNEKKKYGPCQEVFAGSQRSSQVADRKEKLERLGMEKTLDGKRFKASEHGNRAGSVADNEGGWADGKMSAAPLLHRNDPALKFSFKAADPLRIAEGAPFLQVKSAGFTYPGAAEPVLVDVDLSLSAGCRVALQGKNGTGKSTLLKLVTGELEPTSGEVWRHGTLKMAIVDQHGADALAEVSVSPMAHMSECFPSMKDLEIRKQLGSFGVAGDMVLQPLNTMSGGQRMRMLFAKVCAERPHLLVLDEPTNHLDIYSIDALADSLRDFGGGVLLVTHNRNLIQEVAKELFVVNSRTHRVTLVSSAVPDGPPLEVILPSEEDPPEDPRGTRPERGKKGAKAARASAGQEGADGADAKKKPNLPPWLRR